MAIRLSFRLAALLCWLLISAAGAVVVFNYESSPGSSGSTPLRWPENAPIALDENRDTLVMFAHPHCPCTRASIGELNRLLAQAAGRVAAHVVFLKPSEFSSEWTQTALRRSAEEIPGVDVRDDADGALARQFGAQTSGYVVLYNNHGDLLFHGGITAGRGHAGDNSGESAILALAENRETRIAQTPVYGCSLLNQQCSPEKDAAL